MNLKAIRNEKKYTLKKLSELSGVPQRTIEDLEKKGSEANPKLDTAKRLAEALEVTLDYLCK